MNLYTCLSKSLYNDFLFSRVAAAFGLVLGLGGYIWFFHDGIDLLPFLFSLPFLAFYLFLCITPLLPSVASIFGKRILKDLTRSITLKEQHKIRKAAGKYKLFCCFLIGLIQVFNNFYEALKRVLTSFWCRGQASVVGWAGGVTERRKGAGFLSAILAYCTSKRWWKQYSTSR